MEVYEDILKVLDIRTSEMEGRFNEKSKSTLEQQNSNYAFKQAEIDNKLEVLQLTVD